MEDRDRLVLSKAHACPALYSVLSRAGYGISSDELKTFRKLHSRLQGHTDRVKLPYLETSGGSLGQGLSIGVGMALAAKLDKKNWRTYVLMSDGEQEEGNTVEAMMSASHFGLGNLVAIIDVNGLQMDAPTVEVVGAVNIRERYESFGWSTIEVDGHNFEDILEGLARARNIHNKPTAIIALTSKGRGVSFMENRVEWHGKVPDLDAYREAMDELKAEEKKLSSLTEEDIIY